LRPRVNDSGRFRHLSARTGPANGAVNQIFIAGAWA
jgi:hypothetical protein